MTKADENWDSQQFSAGFEINQTLLFKDHGTYTLTLPYGATVPIQIENQVEHMTPYIGVNGGGTADNILKVVIPSVSIITQTIPANPQIEIPAKRDSLILSWEFHNQLPAIVVSYSLPNEISRYNSYSILFGMLIGSGIGVAAEGVVRCYEEDAYTWLVEKFLGVNWRGCSASNSPLAGRGDYKANVKKPPGPLYVNTTDDKASRPISATNP